MSVNSGLHHKRQLSLNRIIPNILTLVALSVGLSAIRFGFQERWEYAVAAITAAVILDALDGRIARILNGTSRFGAELDSLSDFLCFGVAPAFILYFWSMETLGRLGWVVVLVLPICTALRLARFNAALDIKNKPGWMAGFFVGVPSPMGAGIVMLPLLLSFQFDDSFFRRPDVVGVFLVVTGAMLISSLPTFSFKRYKISSAFIVPIMLLVWFFVAMMFYLPWLTLSAIVCLYLTTIPFSIVAYRKKERTPELGSVAIASDEGAQILKIKDQGRQ